MPELGSLVRDDPEWVPVTVGQETFQIAYHPARVTPLWLDGLLNVADPMRMSATLASVLADWDIVQDGQPFPPTADNIAQLPFPVLLAVARVIGDSGSGSEEGNGSSESSGDRPSASTNGTSTATRPGGSVTSTQPASTA